MNLNQPPSGQKTSSRLGLRLEKPAFVLFIVYAASVLGATFPPRLFDPVWQLACAGSLINNAPIALVGLAGLHLAVHLEPHSSGLRSRRSFAARLAGLAVAGFLLLVPLQFMAVWQTLQAREALQSRQMVIADRRIAEMRQAILSSTTVPQLQAELARLKLGSLVVRGNLADQSLSAVRGKLLDSLEASRSSLQAKFRTSGTIMIWNLIQLSLQGVVSAIALALGFAALALQGNGATTLLEEWQNKRFSFRFRFRWPAFLRWPSFQRQAGARKSWKNR